MKAIIFLVLGALLMLAFNLEEVEARCYPNGCSIPFNLPYFYKRRFTPACNKHDVCYACGVNNRWTRRQCDWAFLRDMYSLCRRVRWIQRSSCYVFALNYYKFVALFGWRYYEKTSLRWCRYCPKRNGAPTAALGR